MHIVYKHIQKQYSLINSPFEGLYLVISMGKHLL